jgi:hypothetical protein
MTNPFYGAWKKVRRAYDHIEELHKLVGAFIEGDPYELAYEADYQPFDRYANQHIGETLVVVNLRVVRHPPSIEWGLLIGDAAHNLRSALDHGIWTITTLTSGPAPEGRLRGNDRWRDVSFPIILNSADWHSGLKKLWGLKDPTLIQGLQPFETGPKTPEREPLAVLEELWKIDKHRHLNLVGTYVWPPQRVGQIPPIPLRALQGAGNVATKVIKKRASGPIDGDAELARVVLAGPQFTSDGVKAYMDVYFRPVFDVAFEMGYPAYGGSLFEKLVRLHDAVRDALLILEKAI